MTTLKTFLEQRTKALNSMLTGSSPGTLNSSSWTPSPVEGNGHAVNGRHDPPRPAREVQQAAFAALAVISHTTKTCRQIYQGTDSRPAMMESVLEYIQSDSADPPKEHLPLELQLTTQSLLMTLPSSTHFLLLPQTVRSYKPNVTTSSVTFPHPQFLQRLNEWFNKSSDSLQSAVEQLFLDIRNVRELWSIRTSIRKWVHTTIDLEEPEKRRLNESLDHLSRARIISIWQAVLAESGEVFNSTLKSAVKTSGDNHEEMQRTGTAIFHVRPRCLMDQQKTHQRSTYSNHLNYQHLQQAVVLMSHFRSTGLL